MRRPKNKHRAKTKVVQSSHLLYHYLKEFLYHKDDDRLQDLVADLMVRLGIWFPPSYYAVFPIALPHVVRDPECRANRKLGREEAWGSPNEAGYVRDDNSMIKSLVRSFPIQSDFPQYSNRKLGTGFVAAHVWPNTTRVAITNSFWPNLVWLPREVAILTDQMPFASQIVQELSRQIYRDVPVHPQVNAFSEQAWGMLPEFSERSGFELPNVESLNFFKPRLSSLRSRLKGIQVTSSALDQVANGRPLTAEHSGRHVRKRYRSGLDEGVVGEVAARRLSEYLAGYAKGLEIAMALSP